MRPRQAELARVLREHAIREGEFRLSSGRSSSWYLDGRQVTFRGDCVEIVGAAVVEAVGDLEFDAVGGMALGAVPVALAVALVSGRRAFAVRKEPKEHGVSGRIAGPLARSDRVLVVEDTATTGASLLAACDSIEAVGCPIVAASLLLDRGGEVGAALATRGIPYRPVLDARDLGYEPGS